MNIVQYIDAGLGLLWGHKEGGKKSKSEAWEMPFKCVLKEEELDRWGSRKNFPGRHTSICIVIELEQELDTAELSWSQGKAEVNAECFLRGLRDEFREKGRGQTIKHLCAKLEFECLKVKGNHGKVLGGGNASFCILKIAFWLESSHSQVTISRPRNGGSKFAQGLYAICFGGLHISSSPCDHPSQKSLVFHPASWYQQSCSAGCKATFVKWSLKLGFIVITTLACLLDRRCSHFHSSPQLSPPTFSCFSRFRVTESPCQFLWRFCFVLLCYYYWSLVEFVWAAL